MSPILAPQVAANVLKSCDAPGCNQPRHHLQAWCKDHHVKARAYGHPHAGPLKPKKWAQQRKEVSALLALNPEHPGLLAVLQYLKDWMADGAANEFTRKGGRELARLARHGVTPSTVLTEVLAFWLWVNDNPMALPSDKARDFACSRAVFALAPRDRRATRGPGISGSWGRKTTTPHSYAPKALPSALAYVGAHLRVVLAEFFANTLQSIERQRALKVDREAVMRQPLTISIPFSPPTPKANGLPF